MRVPESAVRDICALITQRLGLDLRVGSPAEPARAVACARELFPQAEPETLAGRLAALGDDSPEWGQLVDRMTIRETYFFRDAAWFETLENRVLLPLLAERRRSGERRLSVWSAGCATGEEAYSLAIVLHRLLPDIADWSVRIHGSDISGAALETARRGAWRPWSFREMPPHVLARWFRTGADGLLEIDAAAKALVSFRAQNLVAGEADADPAAVDLLLCRNMLMYLDVAAQRRVVRRLVQALAPAGWLLTSSAEAWPDLFRPLVPVRLPSLLGFRPQGVGEARPERQAARPATAKPRRASRAAAAPRPREDPPDIMAQARLLADRGEYAKARRLCERGLARSVLDFDGHLLHAQICQELGQSDEARQALRRALYLQPRSASAHFLLGNLHESAGEHEAARRCMHAVIDLAREAGGVEADAESRQLREAAAAFLASDMAGRP